MKVLQIVLAISAFGSSVMTAAPNCGQVVWWGNSSGGETSGTHQHGYSTGVVTTASGVLSNAMAVTANVYFSLALRCDGTVFGWGWNKNGVATGTEIPGVDRTNGVVTIQGQVLTNVIAIASGGNSLALKHDGTVVSWGKNQVPSGLTNVIAIAAKSYFNLALKEDGSVVSWSSDPTVTSAMPAGLSNVISVACGGRDHEHSMALKKDGSIVVWGQGFPSVKDVPADATNAVAIAAGVCHNLALKKDGTVFGWGCNTDGQATGIPTNQHPSDPRSSSGLVTIQGQVLSNVVSIAAGDVYSMALKQDGTIVMWGDKRFYKDVPAGLSSVVAISAGDGFCLAITTNSSASVIKW